MGGDNDRTSYAMIVLISVKLIKKGLRVTIYNDLKPGKHCTEVAKTANNSTAFYWKDF